MTPQKSASTKEGIQETGDIIKTGDFVIVDYVGRVKDTGSLFDLTVEDIARKEKVYHEDEAYGPRLVVVGEGLMLKGFEEALTTMKVGESKTVELPPEKAFGPRDSSKVKVYPVSAFRKSDVKPYVGARLTIEGKTGIVQSVGGGRVRVDFNPLLAGKTLAYDVTTRKKIVDETEKLNELIKRRIKGADASKFQIAREAGTVSITMPKETYLIEGIQLAKTMIARDILKNIDGSSLVRFVEAFDKETFKLK
nr:FKBP-type peptidyl-prolyl cis-trans isomerase [Candidatus Njordarchaeum guaymaensis]